MRILRHGEGEDNCKISAQGDTYMSKLRKTMVILLDEIGERSGCHRKPERSFFYKGYQFPVCARCTGVCLGQIGAILINIFYKIPLHSALICLAFMGFDWGIQELNIKPSTNPRRFLTGFLGGFGLFSIYIAIIKYVFQNKIKDPSSD